MINNDGSANSYRIVRCTPKPEWQDRFSGPDQEEVMFFRYGGQKNLPWDLEEIGGGLGISRRLKFAGSSDVSYVWVPLGFWVGKLTSPHLALEVLSNSEFMEMFDIKKGVWRPFEGLAIKT